MERLEDLSVTEYSGYLHKAILTSNQDQHVSIKAPTICSSYFKNCAFHRHWFLLFRRWCKKRIAILFFYENSREKCISRVKLSIVLLLLAIFSLFSIPIEYVQIC